MSELTARIDNLLEEKGLNRYQLEKAINIGEGCIRKWSQGSSPNTYTLIKVAAYLDTSVEYLMTGEDFLSRKQEYSEYTNMMISKKERQLIDMFSKFSDGYQDVILSSVEKLLDIRQKEMETQKEKLTDKPKPHRESLAEKIKASRKAKEEEERNKHPVVPYLSEDIVERVPIKPDSKD